MGKTTKARRLEVHSDHLRISHGKINEDLPVSEVTRIEIRQAGRFFHHVAFSASIVALIPLGFAADGGDYALPVILFGPPVLAYAAATTPFYLAADGVAFLIPPKVYEIVH
jgi:hypothetical protein